MAVGPCRHGGPLTNADVHQSPWVTAYGGTMVTAVAYDGCD
jgi:hypothetical protein